MLMDVLLSNDSDLVKMSRYSKKIMEHICYHHLSDPRPFMTTIMTAETARMMAPGSKDVNFSGMNTEENLKL